MAPLTHALSPLCVYCAAGWGARKTYQDAARSFGHAMARRGIDLVYGGGKLGLMREIADAVMAGHPEESPENTGKPRTSRHVLGVITHDLKHKEVAHDAISRMVVVESMHERKKYMADHAKAFVALPGGVGTLDELFEILAWAQLGIHSHPVGLLNVDGYFDHLLAFIRHMGKERFLRVDPDKMLIVETDAERLLDALERHVPLQRATWEREPNHAGGSERAVRSGQ